MLKRNRMLALLLGGVGLPLLTGCPFLIDLLRPRTTTVRLVNEGAFPVEVELYYDDDQEIPEALLRETGTRREFTLDPGQVASFSDDCDDLQAVMIDDADLRIVGGIGPETDTGVLRDGDEFGCGDVITFTFDHSEIIVDFDVTFSVD